jgi:hypothetical protein
MRFFTTTRTAVLALALEAFGGLHAQGSGSPYSAYGLGDLLPGGQPAQALKAGTGLGISEPYGLSLGNPASYAALARPVFEAGLMAAATRSESSMGSSSRNSADLTGFSIGVPFGNGKWGIGLGLVPFSESEYASSTTVSTVDGDVDFNYSGGGGVERAFFGVGRSLYRAKPDSMGHAGTVLLLGAEFNFLFGNLEQTRDAVYPASDGYNNTRAFSNLVLRAPTAGASIQWQGDLTHKRLRGGDNWRWGIGLSVDLPTDMNARYSEFISTFVPLNGSEVFKDSVSFTEGAKGTIGLPLGLGLGLGVGNAHWTINAEYRLRDWSTVQVDVPGYALPAAMISATTMAVGAGWRPQDEGGLMRRCVYRAGIRTTSGPVEVRGSTLQATAVTAGLSLPLNAVQTNSWLHAGLEWGQRGSTSDGLVREDHAAFWLGLTFTPWRGERWFSKYKIQ